jgi:hypothetical protein
VRERGHAPPASSSNDDVVFSLVCSWPKVEIGGGASEEA